MVFASKQLKLNKTQKNMTYNEIVKFETLLEERGYRKIYQAKSELTDDYEWYKAFRDKEQTLLYQIFFCFWDFEQYQKDAGWSVSVNVMPESCINNVGRRDLSLSVDWSTDLEKVEKAAELFYETIKKIDVL